MYRSVSFVRCRMSVPARFISPPCSLSRLAVWVSRNSSMISAPTEPNPLQNKSDEKPPQELSPEEYRKYNRLAFGMEGMHQELRSLWLGLQSECTRIEEPLDGTATQRLIEHGLAFCNELQVHHNREEMYLFPKLAARMLEFGPQSALVEQHKQIHIGITTLKQYLLDCRDKEITLDQAHMQKIMDTFSKTLWTHLDEEVYALRAERIRQHWSLDEFRAIP